MSQYQNTGNSNGQRPFSVNNPFRTAAHTQQDASLKQYETDEEFQQWVRQNQQFANNNSNSPYNSQIYGRPMINRSSSSFLSQRSSAFYEDDILDHYKEGSNNNNSRSGNKLEFQQPNAMYQYV